MTADRLKDWLRSRTGAGEQEAVAADLEKTIRRVASDAQLTEDQIVALIAAVRERRVIDKFSAG